MPPWTWHSPAVLVGLLTLFAALIRLPTLGLQSFWLDETITAHDVRGSLPEMFASLRVSELTPPLYFALLWVWTRIAGTSEVAFRLPSALLGIATVPLIYLVARRLASPRAGVIAAAFLASSALMTWFSQEARAYALFLFLSSLTILLFLRVLDQAAPRTVGLWACVGAAALLTHYFAGFLVFFEAAWLLYVHRTRTVAWAAGALALLQLALLPLALHQAAAWAPPTSHAIYLRMLATNVFLSYTTNGYWIHYPLTIALALTVAVGAFVVAGTQRERRAFGIALLLAAPTLLAPLVLQRFGFGIYYDRHLTGGWIPLDLAIASALAAPRVRHLGMLVAAGLCAASLVFVVRTDRRPALQRDDWRGALASLGTASGSRAIATNWTYERFQVEYYRPHASKLSPAGAAVRELDLVGAGEPPPVKVPRGFGLVSRRRVQNLTVVRFVAAAPVVVTRRFLRGDQPDPRRIGVFLER